MSEQIPKTILKLKCKAKGFKAIASALTSFLDEATLVFTPEGIKLSLLDNSRKELIVLNWNAEKFEEYRVVDDKKISFFVNTFHDIFKRFDVDDEVTIEATNNKNSIIITHLNTNRTFDCKLVNSDKDFDELPKVPYEGEFEMTIPQFEEMISDSEVFQAEEAWFISKEGKLWFEGKEDAGIAKGILLEDFNQEIKNTAFRFEYLKPFLQSIKPYVDEKLRVQIGTKKPLHLFLDLGEEIGIMEYFLAPKFDQN